MKLKPFVSAQRVVLDLEGDRQSAVLAALAAPLVNDGVVRDEDAFIADMLAREAQITTVMHNGIALPHARSEAVRKLGMSIGIAAEPGLNYGPDPEARSRLFFCIAVPAFAPTAHIPLLQAVAAFAREDARVARLLKARTPGAVAKQLSTFSG